MSDFPIVISEWLRITKKSWYVAKDGDDYWFVQRMMRSETELGEQNTTLRSFAILEDRVLFLGLAPSVPKNLNAADPDFFPKFSYVLDLIEAMNVN